MSQLPDFYDEIPLDASSAAIDEAELFFDDGITADETAIEAEASRWDDPIINQLLQWPAPELPEQTSNALMRRLLKALSAQLEQGHTALSAALMHDILSDTGWPVHPLITTSPLKQPRPLVLDQNRLYWYRHWAQERALAQTIQQFDQIHSDGDEQPLTQDAAHSLANAQQQQAIRIALQMRFCIITGGPGTGKTFTLAQIVRQLLHTQPDFKIGLAAPTGKAAQRMQEALQQAFAGEIQLLSGLSAVTVHRLLGLGQGTTPFYHAGKPLPYDLVVVDEASMLDLALAEQLFAAIGPDSRLILLGDDHQLTSVEAGSVLHDLVRSPVMAQRVVKLTESKRFSSQAGIGQLANYILTEQQDLTQLQRIFRQNPNQLRLQPIPTVPRRQQRDRIQQYHQQKALERQALTHLFDQLWQPYQAYLDALETGQPFAQLLQAFNQFRILTATREGRLGVKEINKQLSQRWLAYRHQAMRPDGWFIGRPVLVTQNDYALGLANGDIGLCLLNEDGLFEVHFESRTAESVQRLPVSRLPPDQLDRYNS